MQNIKTRDLILCGLFVALISAGAFIKIPNPVVPFTLQFLFTMLAGILLGGRLGALAVATYVIMGLVGIPVFATGGGFGYILKPTFGYLIGFALGAYATGMIANQVPKPDIKRLLTATMSGLIIVYFFGIAYCYIITNFYLGTELGLYPLIIACTFPDIFGDIFLCTVGALLGKRLIPIVHK